MHKMNERGIVTDILLKSNVNCECFPYRGKGMGLVKRWEIPIPVKTGGHKRAEEALDEIEAKLGKLFDRTSIGALADEEIKSGIIFCFGQAKIDLDYARKQGLNPRDIKNVTGNVSFGPGETGYPQDFLNDDGRIDCRLYINLDNVFGKKASIEVAIHEMGHAMGLGEAHFEGFGGENGAVGDEFWEVLKLLYALPIGKYAAD